MMEWLRYLLGLPPGPAESARLVQQVTDLNTKVEGLVDAGDYEEALRIKESYIPILKRLWAVRDVARAYNNAGRFCEQLRRWRRALVYFRKALKEWKRIGEDRGQAVARAGMGRVLIQVGEVDLGRDELELARLSFQKNKDEEGLVHVLHHLVDAYSQLGLHREDLERASDLLAICRRLPDKEQEARALRFVGVAEKKMENYTSALEALGEAESAYKVLGNDDERAAVLEDTASSYVAQQQYDEALKALEKARRLWVNTGDRARESNVQNQLGNVQTSAASYPEAERHYREALRLLPHVDLEHRQQAEATILYNLADLYMRQERYEEAVEYADRADKIFSAAHDYPGSLMALRLRARAEQKQRKKK